MHLFNSSGPAKLCAHHSTAAAAAAALKSSNLVESYITCVYIGIPIYKGARARYVFSWLLPPPGFPQRWAAASAKGAHPTDAISLCEQPAALSRESCLAYMRLRCSIYTRAPRSSPNPLGIYRHSREQSADEYRVMWTRLVRASE